MRPLPLRLMGGVIFSKDGEKLKEIHCPKRIGLMDLIPSRTGNYHCAGCQKEIFNTDFMSEEQLESLLKANPNVCLYINKLNPIFKIEG